MTPNQKIVYDACMDLLERAFNQYGISVEPHHVQISFNLKGRTGGYAIGHGYEDYELRFNIEAVEEHLDFVLNYIIAHEIAHIVCFDQPHLGKNHNPGWKRVCRLLGGSGDRTHNMPLTRAKATKGHIYIVKGEKVTLGTVRHNKLQRGTATYSVKILNYGRVSIKSEMYSHSFMKK